MLIRFKQLTLENFKSHQNILVNFGERTDITGDNGLGKSSILEAITWLLYGNNSFNSKMDPDPTPINYDSEETKVSLLLCADDKDVLLSRALKKGKLSYYINEIPKKATEFNDLVKELFDRELFFSLFNPSYYFTLNKDKKREMLMQYFPSLLNKEVLARMAKEQSEHLSALFKKLSLQDIQGKYSDDKKKLDKQYIQAQTKTKTLQEQLAKSKASSTAPLDSLKAEMSQLVKERNEIEKITDAAGDNNSRINVLQNQINKSLQERDQMLDQWEVLKAEPIEDNCRVCKQPLQEEAVAAVKADKEKRKEDFQATFNAQVSERKLLQDELDTLEYIDVQEQQEKARNLQEKISSLEYEIYSYSQYDSLLKEVDQAEIDEQNVHTELKEAIFTLDCIKAFKAKEAELQAEKVQALFTTLSVRLFKENKGDGELKPDFEIEMDGKPYSTLSLSEKIRAGLELREVLSQQSELIMPVFVDNAESITRFKEPSGQLIVVRVVAGQELKIEVISNEKS